MDACPNLSKLTEREKECLRAWLGHKSAKEIALDLGISHYAVEKRLKMARIKLDVASSIDAARLLGEAEGYGLTVARSPDLLQARPTDQRSGFRKLGIGALIMTLLSAISLALLVQASGEEASLSAEAPADPGRVTEADNNVYDAIENGEDRSVIEFEFVRASPERVRAYVRQMFDASDTDGSGFIELAEAPLRIVSMKPRQPNEPIRPFRKEEVAQEFNGPAAQRQYIATVDKDDDERVSFDEYAEPVMPQYLERGIPLVPADWTPSHPEAKNPG